MAYISLIGDCHSSRILKEHLLNNEFDINFTVWSKGGMKLGYPNGFNPQVLFDKNKKSDGLEEKIKNIDNYYTTEFDKIKDRGVIIIWLGYIDIKLFLPKLNNSYEIINNSINNINNYFKNAKILFAEPLPQFKQFISIKEENLEEINYEKRLQANNNFINDLQNILKEKNMYPAIKQEEVKKIIGLAELDIKDTLPGINYNSKSYEILHDKDALLPEHYYKIYQLFIQKSLDIV